MKKTTKTKQEENIKVDKIARFSSQKKQDAKNDQLFSNDNIILSITETTQAQYEIKKNSTSRFPIFQTLSYNELLKQCKDVFESQYHSIYYDLLKVLQEIFNRWEFVFNDEEQKRFYALSYLFNKYCCCFNETQNKFSNDILVYLNFFYFWFYDFSYCIWNGFGSIEYKSNEEISISESKDELRVLFASLKEINTRLLILTQKNIPNLYKWTIQVSKLKKEHLKDDDLNNTSAFYSGYDIFCLSWKITNFNYLTFPYYVLDEYVLEDKDFLDFYFKPKKSYQNVTLDNSSLNVYKNIYNKYKKMNTYSSLDIAKTENIKSILVRDLLAHN